MSSAPSPPAAGTEALREEFSALYGRHHQEIADYVRRRTGNRHATEDLVADVFVSALQAYPRWRDRGIPIRFWLLRIATHAVNRWARGRRRLRPVRLDDEPAERERSPANPDAARVTEALLTLPPRRQSVLVLHHVQELGVREIAAILGCREGTVKSRLARARAAFRDHLIRLRRSDDRSS